MGDAAAYAYIALTEAIKDAGLIEDQVSNVRTGLIMGSGGASSSNLVEAADILRSKGVKRIGPYRVTQTMGSTISACLATPFKIKGVNYSISSACATSAHCIGSAMEQIQLGKQDVVFAGGGEEEHWTLSCLFDAMGALSTRNDSPDTASRAYDANRDGFIIAGGAGVHEAIYSLIMMKNNFVCASANIEELDAEAVNFPIVQGNIEHIKLDRVMSNSFGFGGTNASLIFQRLDVS